MGSNKLLLGAFVGAGVLSTVAVAAAALQVWWLLTAAVMVLISATCIASLDADRRVKNLHGRVVKDLKRVRADAAAPQRRQPVDPSQDVLGSVRLLQAQYTGRLDRLQTSLESALAQKPLRTTAPRSDQQPSE